MSTNKYGPVEAAVRQALDTVGKLQSDLNACYPSNKKMEQAYRDAIARLKATAESLRNSVSTDLASADWNNALSGNAAHILINENLLKPLAELANSNPTYDDRKNCVCAGLERLCESLEIDADGLERNAQTRDTYE